MKNRVTVTIAGREYTLVAEEETSYMKEVARYVDKEFSQVQRNIKALDGATVAALNIADTLFKERAAAEDLRRQLKAALDENAALSRQLKDNKGKDQPKDGGQSQFPYSGPSGQSRKKK